MIFDKFLPISGVFFSPNFWEEGNNSINLEPDNNSLPLYASFSSWLDETNKWNYLIFKWNDQETWLKILILMLWSQISALIFYRCFKNIMKYSHLNFWVSTTKIKIFENFKFFVDLSKSLNIHAIGIKNCKK